MDEQTSAPYAALTPDCVLDALQSVGFEGDGRLLGLNSYENRVYRASLVDGGVIVTKFYRPGRWSDEAILEEHAFAQELADREVPVVAPLPLSGAAEPTTTLAHHGGFRFAVYPYHGGRAPELEDRATLTWIGRFIGRIHAVGATRAFHARGSLDIASFGEEPRDYLLANDFLPPDLLPAWRAAVDLALDAVRRCHERAGRVQSIRLHGDCHAGNILWTDITGASLENSASGPPGRRVAGSARPAVGVPGPHFVDLDDARMGPAVQDLWMLLSGDRQDMTRALDAVLQGYCQFHDFDVRELHLVEALRTLRLIHYAGWIARRWNDPAFPAAFPWFNTQRYWQDRILELREQIALMDEPPLEWKGMN